MACRLCGAPSEAIVCEICQSARKVARKSAGARCRNCGLPIEERPGGPPLCQVCSALLLAVSRSEWLIRAQAEWDKENALLAKKKQELLGLRGPLAA